MSYIKGKKTKTMAETKRKSSMTVKEISNLPYADLSSRGIRPEIVEQFNVRMTRSQQDGVTPTAFFFPYYDRRDTLCGWKKKDLTVAKNDEYHYTTIGKVGVDCKLFGMKQAEQVKRSRKKLIFVEGEVDLLATYQIAVDAVADTKYEGLEPHVVSLSCGTGNAVEAVIHNQEFVESFEQVILGFDSDSSTPKEIKKGIMRGKEATDAVATHLMGMNIAVGNMPEGCKDPNDALTDGKAKELYNNLFFRAEKYKAEKVLTAADMDFEELIKDRPEGIMIPNMPLLMEKLHGFRKRELVIVTSMSGTGKSTTVGDIAFWLGMSDQRVGMIFLEESEKDTEQRLLARYCEVNFNKFRASPTKTVAREKIQEAYDWTKDGERYVFLDHFGSLKIEDLMQKLKSFLHVNKVDFIILDHLSMVVSGSASDNERRDLEILTTELAAFCAANDVGVIAVCHLNRDAKEALKGLGRIEEPTWIKVKKEDLKGASGLEQLAWTIIGIDFEVMPDGSRGRIRPSVLKNRTWGYLGEGDILRMNDVTGVLEDASGEVVAGSEENIPVEF